MEKQANRSELLIIFRRFFSLIIGITFSILMVNGQDNNVNFNVSDPKEYKIAGLTVEGIKHSDPRTIKLLSGLKEGEIVQIPGDRISNAIKNLWKQQLFSDIQIKVNNVEDNSIYLSIFVTERPRLSKFKFNGIKKSERDNIKEAIKLYTGKIVNENLIINTKKRVNNYFIEKGFLDVKTHINQVNDTVLNNSVILVIDVKKGNKIKINEIRFVGNEEMPVPKLKRLLKKTKEKKWYRIFSPSKFNEDLYKEDKKKLIAKYNEKGFRDIRILNDSIYRFDDKTINIDITLDEGNKYYIRNINWVGNTKYSTEVLNAILGVKKGDLYNQKELESRLFMNPNGNDVSSLYMDDGYLFFRVTPVEVAVENDSIDFEMRIIEGKQARVNRILINGNTKTNDHVILREIRTKPGDLFNRTAIIRTQRELSQLGYFNPETLNVNPIPNAQDGTVDIEYTVEEQSSDQIELSAGWGQNRLIGTLGLTFNNFSINNVFERGAWAPVPSGDGQRVSIRAQSNGNWFQSYNASFTEPWLGGKKPNSLTVSLFHSSSSPGGGKYIRRDKEKEPNPRYQNIKVSGVAAGLGKRLQWPDDFFTLYSELSYQNFNATNFQQFVLSDGLSDNISLNFIFSRNSVNKPIYPDGGAQIAFTAKATPPFSLITGKDFSGATKEEKFRLAEYHKWKFTSSWFTPLTNGKNKLVLHTKMGFGFLGYYNEDIGTSPFERFYLGGNPIGNIQMYGQEIVALRGYEDNGISSEQGDPFISKYKVELRYPLSLNPSATLFALAFAEAGNTWTEFKKFNPFVVKRSAGFGVRIFLPMFGLMGLDYGFGFDRLNPNSNDRGFDPGKGKFHFTIGMNLGEL